MPIATLTEGGAFTDTRGILKYVNEDDPGHYRRFYLITHNDIQVVRAWQGHKKEEKAFYVINGGFTIAVVTPENFEDLSFDEEAVLFKLTEENKNFLRVRGGSYTGVKALVPNSTLLVLSSLTLSDSKKDDYRQPANKWVDWNLIK